MSGTDTRDPIDDELSSVLKQRGAAARPSAPRFHDVEARARTRRQRHKARLAGTGALVVVLLVLAVVVASGRRTPDPDRVSVAGPPATGAPVWATPADRRPSLIAQPHETVAGVQPHLKGISDVDIEPYLRASIGPQQATLYHLTADRWTVATATFEPQSGDQGSITSSVVRGEGFRADRFVEVPARQVGPPGPNGERFYEPADAAGARAVAPPVEHLGDFDWTFFADACDPGTTTCATDAIGGDEQLVIVVRAYAPAGYDLRGWVAGITLRTGDQLGITPVGMPPPTKVPTFVDDGLFVRRNVPIVPNDSVWPTEVPTDFCPAFKQWKQIQMDELGAFGTEGWSRWADALASMAPPELAPDFTLLAAEERGGHDVSTSEPGMSALGRVVAYGDSHCP